MRICPPGAVYYYTVTARNIARLTARLLKQGRCELKWKLPNT